MPRRLIGIYRRRGGWRVDVRVNRKLYTKQFPRDTPVAEMRKWREDQIDTFGPQRHDADFALARRQLLRRGRTIECDQIVQNPIRQSAGQRGVRLAGRSSTRPAVTP